jgi:hypothetical protein
MRPGDGDGRWYRASRAASLLIFVGATVGYVSRRLGHMSLRRERVLVLGVILALLSAGCGSGGKLGAKALSQQSKLLQSEASEGALLAQDAVSGKTTRIYTREHSSDLYKAASQAEASLKAAKTEPALQPRLRRLAALASQVSSALERLRGASKDEQRALGRELQTAARESKRIGKGLRSRGRRRARSSRSLVSLRRQPDGSTSTSSSASWERR